MTKAKYGRGKFKAHENYVAYMKYIVDHPSYSGMPNAVAASGKINWQVSSGKTTGFYEDYLARKDWWLKKADEIGAEGTGEEGGRLTLTARLIHPTGYRNCRLCGKSTNVGYFYVNSNLYKQLSNSFPSEDFEIHQSISSVVENLFASKYKESVVVFLQTNFPERIDYFNKYGFSKTAFEKSNFLRSNRLSPGFMGNPPDRLDGFHDYDVFCRKKSDPGRHDENMRSYNHDRRSFEWWNEGDWALADALYNKAGSGYCSHQNCNKQLTRISPDHVGPLSCGFKQNGIFLPTCPEHNSAKNRRFTQSDVKYLIEKENQTGEICASWQVKAHWNKYKLQIDNDKDAFLLSNSLRSLQDMYLRVLWEALQAGRITFLVRFIKPQLAYVNYEFRDLDASNLVYSTYHTTESKTNLRRSFATRIPRIALNSLKEYSSKSARSRKLLRLDFELHQNEIQSALTQIRSFEDELDKRWLNVWRISANEEEFHRNSSEILNSMDMNFQKSDAAIYGVLSDLFDNVGITTAL